MPNLNTNLYVILIKLVGYRFIEWNTWITWGFKALDLVLFSRLACFPLLIVRLCLIGMWDDCVFMLIWLLFLAFYFYLAFFLWRDRARTHPLGLHCPHALHCKFKRLSQESLKWRDWDTHPQAIIHVPLEFMFKLWIHKRKIEWLCQPYRRTFKFIYSLKNVGQIIKFDWPYPQWPEPGSPFQGFAIFFFSLQIRRLGEHKFTCNKYISHCPHNNKSPWNLRKATQMKN